MDVPSMVQRSGDTLIVRSVVSGNQLYFDKKHENKASEKLELLQLNQATLPSSLGCSEQSVLFENNVIPSNCRLSSANETGESENQVDVKDEGLPQCKIKRNYSCSSCTFFTQNPRYFLTHLRDKHGEKIVINECRLCLYASRHYQKLVRHMKMVHGSTDGIEGNGTARKRQLSRENRKRKVGNQILEILPNFESSAPRIYTENKIRITQLKPNKDIQQNTHQSQKFEDFLGDYSKNRLKCSICEFTTLHRSQLIVHENDEHCNAKFFRCEKCSYVTHIKARFSKHVKYHSMPMIKCFMCDFRTPYKWNLDRHMKNHGGTGAFKCAACNFTADIKQSLTVHEMNHHIPPVGNAAGMTNIKKKNKVGGTDISDEFLSEIGDTEEDSNSINISCGNTDNENYNYDTSNYTDIVRWDCGDHNNLKEYNNNNDKNCSNNNINQTHICNNILNENNESDNNNKFLNGKTNNINICKISKNVNISSNIFDASKSEFQNCKQDQHGSNIKASIGNDRDGENNKNKNIKQCEQVSSIANHSNDINEDIDLNNRCTLSKPETDTKCGNLEYDSFSNTKKFKCNIEDLPTDLSHKSMLHEIMKPNFCYNKSNRPIPKLIPIQTSAPIILHSKSLSLPNDSQLHDEVHNLQQIVTMLFGKDIPQELLSNLPLLSPGSDFNNSEKYGGVGLSDSVNYLLHKNSQSFFNKLKQRFPGNENSLAKLENLTCTCGYICKCLSELYKHRNTCQISSCEVDRNQNIDCKKHSNLFPINLSTNINSASIRCHICRHRCKSSADLMNHLKSCGETVNQNDFSDSSLDTTEQNIVAYNEDTEKLLMKKHPMEDKVFIWNDVNSSFQNSRKGENVVEVKKRNSNKIDEHQLNISTHYESDEKIDEISYYGVETAPGYGEVTKTIPSEEDTANASLKKVYKCPHCSFWASTASRFHVHIVGHLNKKPFECSLCNYRSNWRWDITKHIRLKTIRDPSHKNAKVLMNDETGRRNYTKYNKYITLMKVTDEDGDPKLMKSGEMTPNQEASLSFIKDYENKNAFGVLGGDNTIPDVTLTSNSSSSALTYNSCNKEKKENFKFLPVENELLIEQYADLMPSEYDKEETLSRCDPPDLFKNENLSKNKTCDEERICIKSAEDCVENKVLYCCKECNYKNFNKAMLESHIKHHVSPNFVNLQSNFNSSLQSKGNSNYANLMNDMLAAILKQQLSENNKSENNILQEAQTFTALNLNLTALASLSKTQHENIDSRSGHNITKNEHGEIEEASSVGVVTPSATTPTNDSPSPNATASTNHLLNKNTKNVSNNKKNNDICNKNINMANAISTSNALVNGNSNSGSTITSVIGGIISGSSSFKNSILSTHSAIEQNINHKNFNNILNHSNNMGIHGSNSHNNTDQWRGPAPYRCGHCHQVSNWKHVIQRHCRLKHNGDIRIETIDRLSDKITPVYRTLDPYSNHQSGRKSSQTIKIIKELSSQQEIIENTSNINTDVNNTSSTSYAKLHEVNKNDEVLEPEPARSTQVSNSNGNLTKQYECKVCGLLFNKKQKLFLHAKHTHDDHPQDVAENILPIQVQNTSSINKNNLSNQSNSKIDNGDHENENHEEMKVNEEEGKCVVDLISSYEHNSETPDVVQNLTFCQDCPARYLSKQDFYEHIKSHQMILNKNESNYKCNFCSFKAKQEFSLLTHFSVHRQGYQDRTEILLKKYKEDKEYCQPVLEKVTDIWVVKRKNYPKIKKSPITHIDEESLLKCQLQENSVLLGQTCALANRGGNNLNTNIHQVILDNNSISMQIEKCSHCPFETNNSEIYKNHLQHHYIVSKTKLNYSCPHCDYSCNEEIGLKSHLQVHFSFLNNNNKIVAFFTSYNNLEINLNKDLSNACADYEDIFNNLVLYRSLDVKIDNFEIQNNVMLPASSENMQKESDNYKNVVDIKTGQTMFVETKSN
ncbi:putative uncharacterized protein DDB_G0282133 isoform X2 [Condylostylus longicornis]|uniref:putative uncharacterized protein DDB_G0282133 isoform X2 n=1 Tax=Condylostylus longicornis TaxID=2530218 RepID=UPI00244DB5AE|nr:putative uncharacterized protein DDB_G0282133 isoform X2 [Condylostylus longicornis]